MKQYVIIEADTNDGDYVTEKTEITNEEIDTLKNVLSKMPRQKDYKGNELPCIRYETQEMGNDDQEDSEYQHITYEEKQFLDRFLPFGDPNYGGIHTIENVDIVSEGEKLL